MISSATAQYNLSESTHVDGGKKRRSDLDDSELEVRPSVRSKKEKSLKLTLKLQLHMVEMALALVRVRRGLI
jgi:hypothetical protein